MQGIGQLQTEGGALAQTIDPSGNEAVLSAPAIGRHARTRTDAFGRAERHSRTVRRLKIALPVAAIAMIAGFAGLSVLSTPTAISVEDQGSDVADGKLVMANPKLEGFTKDGRPYSMVAGRAIQDFDQQGIVKLEAIDATMPVDKDNWARVQTESGIYNRNDNTLDAKTDIVVTTSDGMIAKLKSAFLDINNGNLKTSDPVDIQANGATITAGSMAILDNGKRIIFETRVRMNIDPESMKAAEAAKGGLDVSN